MASTMVYTCGLYSYGLNDESAARCAEALAGWCMPRPADMGMGMVMDMCMGVGMDMRTDIYMDMCTSMHAVWTGRYIAGE